MSKEAALKLVDELAERTGAPFFKKLSRTQVIDGLRARINDPFLIQQGPTGTCAVASTVFSIAKSDPVAYARAVIQLYEIGATIIKNWTIKPDKELRDSLSPTNVNDADWVILASIRDSENWFFDYHAKKDGWGDGSTDDEVVKWLKKAGFQDVKDETYTGFLTRTSVKEENLKKARELYNSNNYHIIFDINSSCIDSGIPSAPTVRGGNHIVALAGDFTIPASHDHRIVIPIFSWGARTSIPRQGGLTYGQFLDQYFGYVAAKF